MIEQLSQEQQFMLLLRKTLTSIVRETAPRDGVGSPFSEQTIEDIRLCLAVISAREQELAVEQGRESLMRPYFVDEGQNAEVITLHPRKPSST
jgi:hypothetical protein